MSDIDKKEKVASALYRLTDRGELEWEEFDADDEVLPDSLGAPEDGSVFTAIYEGMDLFLYAAEDESTVFRIVEPESEIGWTFPELDVLDELHEHVEFRASGLEEWMDTVLENAELDDADEDGSEDEASVGADASDEMNDAGDDSAGESVAEMGERIAADPTESDSDSDDFNSEEDEFGAEENDDNIDIL